MIRCNVAAGGAPDGSYMVYSVLIPDTVKIHYRKSE
jgi:hypothetical protein